MGKRKPIRTREDAERVAYRVKHDTEALWRAVGGDDSPMYGDEILDLHHLERRADFMWQKLLRRQP